MYYWIEADGKGHVFISYCDGYVFCIHCESAVGVSCDDVTPFGKTAR
jgi:hypothetical protein